MAYIEKSAKDQKNDLEIISKARWRRDVYFDLLQLRNKLVGINTYDKVNEADRAFSERRAAMLIKNHAVSGECDLTHLLNIHEYLFQDIYYFAGKIRDVPMEIDPVTKFTDPKVLSDKLNGYFASLKKDDNLKGMPKDQFVKQMSSYLTDINILHPFREGNGRTKRIFFSELAEQANYSLDWSACKSEEWKMADECAFDSSRDGKRDLSYLQILLDRAVKPLVKEKAGEITKEWKNFYESRDKLDKSTESISALKKSNKNVLE